MSLKLFSSPLMQGLKDRFRRLYGEKGDQCVRRLAMLIGRYEVGNNVKSDAETWSEKDIVLITYGDMISDPPERPLVTLEKFVENKLKGIINTVHVLPFFPYSSDDGFSIVDYRKVRPELGDWNNIQSLSKKVRIMADLVLNHVSSKSDWFRAYTMGIAPERYYFVEADPGTDLSAVVRPRNLPLLTPVRTNDGERFVWTTFSSDQIDLNFANPDVLFEFLDILFLYISKGVRIIRLDAIAYLWKEVGTSCIHLWQTHEVVKIIRDVLEIVAPDVWLITETNVPYKENVSYFGEGDEAHIVYQFTLPPLLLHAIETADSSYLTNWLSTFSSAPPGCTFLNFTASHDGVGVRPLEGIVPDSGLNRLVDSVKKHGGRVSSKANSDGTESPYELNITYFDALADGGGKGSEMHIKRFMCSQAVALALAGIPAVYFHSLVGTGNDYELVERTGRARSINRKKLNARELYQELDIDNSVASRVFNEYRRLLKIRTEQPAFHPSGIQMVLDLGPSVFALERISPDGDESLLALSNFTSSNQQVSLEKSFPALKYAPAWKDCISGTICSSAQRKLNLQPYQTVWLVPEQR